MNEHNLLSVDDIEDSIHLLKTHVDEVEINAFIDALEALKTDTYNWDLYEQLFEEFRKLGITQGAVLTYVHAMIHLLSDDPFAGVDGADD